MNENLIDTNALQQQVFSGNFSVVRHNDLVEGLYKIDIAQELNDPHDVARWKNRFRNLFNNSIQPAQTNATAQRENPSHLLTLTNTRSQLRSLVSANIAQERRSSRKSFLAYPNQFAGPLHTHRKSV